VLYSSEENLEFFMNFKKYFLRTVELAASVKGITSPNPAVGCLIVKNGRIIGEGATQKAGSDHAEKVALKKAGNGAKGSDLYVTLEPCINYTGKKTASCVGAIIKAGIKKTYVGMMDPNPDINGKGIIELRKAGIEVIILDDYHKEIKSLNEDFFKYIQTGLPFVYAKCAMTLDGYIADKYGDSKWISCEESRCYVHKMRNRVDAVLVGVGTVLKDNPELNVRMVSKLKDPIRIILDPHGRTTESSFVMADKGRTLFIIKKGINKAFKIICDKHKKEWVEFDTQIDSQSGKDNFNLKEVITHLGKKKKFESIMIEGGNRVYSLALNERITDKLIIFIAPKILGGDGIPFLSGKNDFTITDALNVRDISSENIGEDILIQGYL
jgi:diaminohydroxyphosphoribosylaminopyrimidine deaminase/5-amino-6-(5-phosphoribosylamino)uracil reductase